MLDRISDFSNQESTYYFPPRRIIKDLNSVISGNVDSETNRKLSEILSVSDTGAMIFRNGEKGYLIEPPFPIIEDDKYNNYNFYPLINILNQPRVIGVISLRLGRFAVGVYQGRKLISSKNGLSSKNQNNRTSTQLDEAPILPSHSDLIAVDTQYTD